MDKVLKRRLIGASILIALAVIFVPMLLVGPDSVRDGADSALSVPPMPDSAGEVRRIPLDPDAARIAAPSSRSTSSAGDQSSADQTPAVSRDSAVDDDAAAEPARPAPDDRIVLRPDLAEPEAGAEPQPESRAVEREESGTETPVADDATESTPDPPEPAEPAPTAASGQETQAAATGEVSLGDWVVQVASFGSSEAADRIRGRLEALGHIVVRDEIVRGQSLLYRLRTGPYPSRAAAQTALEQIGATVDGVEPIVRRLEQEAGAGREPGFAVQVGSFVSEDNAKGETGRLAELGFESFRFSEQVGERLIWRVMVGPVPERSAAEALKSRVIEQAGVDGLVVSYP